MIIEQFVGCDLFYVLLNFSSISSSLFIALTVLKLETIRLTIEAEFLWVYSDMFLLKYPWIPPLRIIRGNIA